MRSILCLTLAWALAPSVATAQWGAGALPEEQSPPPGTEVASAPPPAPVPVRYAAAPRAYWILWNFNLGVPILLDSDRDVVRPGANLNARLAFTTRFIGGGIQGAWQWVPIDLDASRAPGVQGVGRDPMRRGSFGPFLHLQAPTRIGFTPYAQGGFDMNFWNFRERAVYCDYWVCYTRDVYRFTPGFHGRFGGQFAMGGASSRLHLDLGVEIGMSFPGEFFVENQPWVTPYLGMSFKH
jgi:hypothetical protein